MPAIVEKAVRQEVDMSQFPNVMSIMENLKTIPEFVTCHED